MSTMNISLPEAMKAFIDQQVAHGSYGTSSEYLRELIRREQERLSLRELLLDGARSLPTGVADEKYFAALRTQLKPAPTSKPRKKA